MLYIPCVEFQFYLISKRGRDSDKEGDNAPPALPLNEALHLNHTSFKGWVQHIQRVYLLGFRISWSCLTYLM